MLHKRKRKPQTQTQGCARPAEIQRDPSWIQADTHIGPDREQLAQLAAAFSGLRADAADRIAVKMDAAASAPVAATALGGASKRQGIVHVSDGRPVRSRTREQRHCHCHSQPCSKANNQLTPPLRSRTPQRYSSRARPNCPS
jgi:hypothetical protein